MALFEAFWLTNESLSTLFANFFQKGLLDDAVVVVVAVVDPDVEIVGLYGSVIAMKKLNEIK